MARRKTSTANPAQSKGCTIVLLAFVTLIGLAFTGVMGLVTWRGAAVYFWQPTPCVIVQSREVDHSAEPGESRDYIITYRYTASDGQSRTSETLHRGMHETIEGSKIRKLLARYPAGARKTCYVNPSNFAEAALERTSLWMGFILLIPLVFVGVGALGLVSTLSPPTARHLSGQTTSKGSGTAGMVLFSGIFVLVGGAFFYFLTVRTLLVWNNARSWQEVPCTIVSSTVGHHSDSDGTTYSIDITYRYRLNGRDYESDRYDILGGSSSGYKSKAAIVARYPVNSKAVCYVDPANPEEALLDRSPSWFWLIGLIPLIFLVIGISGFITACGGFGRGTNAGSGVFPSPILPPGTGLPGGPDLPHAPGGGIVLQPLISARAKFFGLLIASLFWNGIVGVFVGFALNSWFSGRPEIFLSIFILPFAAIGLLLLGATGWMLLNLFNPRIVLTASSLQLPLGSTLSVQWRVDGKASRIRNLRIQLEGRESASYIRGTTRSTDTNTFARLPLFETSDSIMISQGQAALTIPLETVPSWSAVHNKIEWRLQVRGEIPRFPDINDDYPITILPAHR